MSAAEQLHDWDGPRMLPKQSFLMRQALDPMFPLHTDTSGGDGETQAPHAIVAFDTLKRFVSAGLAEPLTAPPPGERPPLYEPDGTGGWRAHWTAYDAEAAQAWMEREWLRCASDPLYFLTHYCYALNLHDEAVELDAGSDVELIPDWPHVHAMVDALWPPRDVLILKSRRMMASWIMMAAILHDLLFREHWPVMVMSRVQDLVDDGGTNSSVDSLLGKVRFIWDGLPQFLRIHPLTFKYLFIANEARNVVVKGFPSSNSPGRGGGFKRAILDEFAHVSHSEQVMASVGHACASGKVYTSTPLGRGNAFYRIYKESYEAFPSPKPRTSVRQVALYRIMWHMHPHRDTAWRQRVIEANAMTVEAIAQELDACFNKSMGGRVYPTFDVDIHVAGGSRAYLSDVTYDPMRPIYMTWDFNPDPLICVLMQVHGPHPRFRIIGEICMRDAIVDDNVLEFVFRYASQGKIMHWTEREPEWGDRYGRIYRSLAGPSGHCAPVILTGDATEEKKNTLIRIKTYQHVKQMLREYGGFEVLMRTPASNPPRQLRFETVNDALRKNEVVLHPSCEQLKRDFEEGVWDGTFLDMNQKTKDDDGSGLTRSHASSAFGYALVPLHKVGTAAAPFARKRERVPLREQLASIKRW